MFFSEIFFEFCQGFFYAMNRFIYNNCILFIYERLEHGLSSFFDGEKPEIEILMTIYSACYESR